MRQPGSDQAHRDYDATRGKLVEIPHIIAATANFPANNVAELIALAKKDLGKINYASPGLVDLVQVEQVFARPGAICARGERLRSCAYVVSFHFANS